MRSNKTIRAMTLFLKINCNKPFFACSSSAFLNDFLFLFLLNEITAFGNWCFFPTHSSYSVSQANETWWASKSILHSSSVRRFRFANMKVSLWSLQAELQKPQRSIFSWKNILYSYKFSWWYLFWLFFFPINTYIIFDYFIKASQR